MKEAELNGILRELHVLFEALPDSALERTERALRGHKRIFFYGAGRSGLMLRALAMRLMQMGRCVYVVGETVTPAIEPGDLLFMASASGRTLSVRRYAETAKQVGADLWIISAAEESPLAGLHAPDVLLRASSKEDAAGSAQVMGSLFEQALLLFGDALVLRMAGDAGEMRRAHANLE